MYPREKANLHLLTNERMIIPFLHNNCGIKLLLWRKTVLYLMAKKEKEKRKKEQGDFEGRISAKAEQLRSLAGAKQQAWLTPG